MDSLVKIKSISIRNFKSLYDVSIEPGNVNVLIGANGAGKSSILEAIGVLTAAMTDRVNDSTLQRKGVRLSASSLYKSKFLDIEKEPISVDFSLGWELAENKYQYNTHLTVPTNDDAWKYHTESVFKDEKPVFGRSNHSRQQMNNRIGYFNLSDTLASQEYRQINNYISGYGIFQPNTLTLRGNIPDPVQMSPIGLHGGRLAEALDVLLKTINGEAYLGSLSLDEVIELIDWASDFRVGRPGKANLNPGVPTTSQIIEFHDRYLKDSALFTGYDASEGALYVLFMLCLAMHPDTPRFFAVDSFDHAMNPRLAKRITKVFSKLVVDSGRTVFMTTHNPLVLDGLNLLDERIRLFALDRDENGHVIINRIQVSEELLQTGMSLSRLWINGYLGGVPELI